MKSYTNEIVSLTMDLIRFKTMAHDHGQLDQCTRYIESYLKKAGIAFSRQDIDNIPSILVIPDPDVKKFPVLLMSHIDVVAAPDNLFEPRIDGLKLYGRGSADDKYAVALSLVLMKNHMARLKAAGRGQKDLAFGILITGDEETGGQNGAAELLKGICPDFSIALDGGSPDEVIAREKGVLRLTLESFGKSCHGARPWLGENAVQGLFEDYSVIQTFFTKTAKGNWHRTINPAIVKGGTVINQVPDYCQMQFDIRYTENDDIDALVTQMKAKINGTLTIQSKEPVFVTEPCKNLDRLLALDKDMKTGFEHGASDARFLMNFGLAGVVWGAQGNLSHHSENEHVQIDSIELLYDRLERFLDLT